VCLLCVIEMEGFCGEGGEDGWKAHTLVWGCYLEVLLEEGVGVFCVEFGEGEIG
jgi:hypothetical protein